MARRRRPGIRPAAPEDPLGPVRRGLRWGLWSAVALVLVASIAALWASQHLWTFDRVAERHRHAPPERAWFLWARVYDGVVARTPGGEPLPGSWKLFDSRGGWELSGAPAPLQAPDAQGALAAGTWRGQQTTRAQNVVGGPWTEVARKGYPQDFAELGRAPELLGRWHVSFPTARGVVDLATDGRVVSPDGAPLGRWAGQDRVLLMYFPGWDQTEVWRLVRLDSPEHRWGTGPAFETLGCVIHAVWRDPEPPRDSGVR